MSRIICRIDLEQLKQNFNVLLQHANSCRLMPVLKYDAYGLGAKKIGTALREAGAYRFATAEINEALDVQQLGLDVQILGILMPDEISEVVASGVIAPVCQYETARLLSAEAVRQNRFVRIAIKLDTGMGRLGFSPETDAELIAEIVKLPHLVPDGIFSHFSTAAEPDLDYASFQLGRFKSMLHTLTQAGINFPHIHHAAGDAILKVPESTLPPFNVARPGGAMYGEDFHSPCRQIITLTTRIGALRTIPAGGSVGYFRKFRAEKNTPVAVLPAGYADGIPLALSNKGEVIIRGKKCPILGRISMDYTVVDISAVPDAHVGDTVTLLGQDGACSVSVADWGKLKSTHSHDIWCSLGHRVVRV